MSSMPGAAVATTSMTPVRRQPLGDAAEPVLAEVLLERRRAPRSAQHRDVGPTSSASTGLPSSSTTSTRRPASAAARARTAVTVVLPTPPLPATTTRDARAADNDSARDRRTPEAPLRRLAIGLLAAAAGLDLSARASRLRRDADRRADAATTVGRVDVLQVSGLFDPIVVDAIDDAIDRAVDDGAQALDPAGQQPRRRRRATTRWRT